MDIELVFIHGWGFDLHFWDALSALLPQFPQTHIDLGFFGAPSEEPRNRSLRKRILIGHSLGFTYGIKNRQDWKGWIAINGFTRFVKNEGDAGCVTAASLRDMRVRLRADPTKTLRDFYASIGAPPVTGTPNPERLREGLDELRYGDIENTLPGLDVPGLALAGCKDPLVPVVESEALGRLAKQGGLRMLDEAGHLLPQMAPGWCAGMIADYIGENFG